MLNYICGRNDRNDLTWKTWTSDELTGSWSGLWRGFGFGLMSCWFCSFLTNGVRVVLLLWWSAAPTNRRDSTSLEYLLLLALLINIISSSIRSRLWSSLLAGITAERGSAAIMHPPFTALDWHMNPLILISNKNNLRRGNKEYGNLIRELTYTNILLALAN